MGYARQIVAQKHCPKCKGNIYLDSDQNGWFENCLQCGYTHDIGSISDITEEDNAPPVSISAKN